MINMILYFLATMTTGYLALIYPKKMVITLFVLELLLFLPALIYSFYLSGKIRITVRVPVSVTEKKQPVDVDIMVDNQGKIPIFRGKLVIDVKNYYHEGSIKQKLQLQADKNCRTSCTFRVSSGNCGKIKISIKRFFIGDPIGILYFPVNNVKEKGFISVLPKIEPMQLEVNDGNWDIMADSDEYDITKAGDDPSEVFQVRSYRGGDRMQSIHWKMSARSEELMVKEYSKPVYYAAVLFLDMKEPNNGKYFKNADEYLEKTLGISYGLLESDCYHIVVWYDGKENRLYRFKIDKQDHIYELIEQLFQILPYGEEVNLEELYHQEHPDHSYCLSYMLNMNLELWGGGGFSCRSEKKLL